MVTHHEKCIRRPVPIVGKNVKFPLNQMALDLFTARTAIRNIGHQGDIKSLSSSMIILSWKSFFLFFFHNTINRVTILFSTVSLSITSVLYIVF